MVDAALGYIKVMRGDRTLIPVTKRFDDGRSLDGSETWTFAVRRYKTDATALLTLQSPVDIEIDSLSYQPTIIIGAGTLDTTNFPPSEEPISYWFDLVMTKDGSPETKQGRFIVVTDVER